jgi:hypothetical protein
MFGFLKGLLHGGSGLVCPRCEKALEGHDEAECARRMSRRYFFGVAAGAAAVIAGAVNLPVSGVAIRNTFLTPLQVSNEMLEILRNSIRRELARMPTPYLDAFARKIPNYGMKIGESIAERRPQRLVAFQSI